MNANQNKKVHSEKPFPGCLGRMVNLFDTRAGITGNRLLTDRPHGSGSSLSRSRSDVARMLSPPFGDHVEEKQIVSELSRNAYDNTTTMPMKMLIAQELSKEVNARHNPPNVVAKLMGLDTLPRQRSDSAAVRSHSKGYSRRSLSHSSIPLECWQQDDGFLDKGIQSEYSGQNECRDVYEMWQQSQKSNYDRDKSPQKIKYCKNINEKKMALVREKFMEAKRLATDEKLRRSKEFQEALEVLSSNKDLFLKFLQEPNSLFSQHFSDMQSIPPPPETKRITVLRPSKMVDREKLPGSGKNSDNHVTEPAHTVQVAGWDKSISDHSSTVVNPSDEECLTQPTRIVVLKPTPGKTHEIKAVVSPPSPPPRVLREDLLEELEDEEVRESREVAKEITRQMRENLMGHRRDETLLSSVLSNGYIGDESSFDKSENEYTVGNLSDSEVMSPTSKHSWDYLNRSGSPYSSSSFSRASCSPESSVCREAKKRLSERWAMLASNGNSQEQRHVRRSSSTLGEMLALSDSKKLVKAVEDGNNKGQEPRGSTSVLSTHVNTEDVDDFPINLPRSKSLPGSPTVYGARLNAEASDPEVGKSLVRKDLTEAKSMTSALKGKVSSLFFSRSKRLNKERSSASHSKDESQSSVTEVAAHPRVIGTSPLNNDDDLEEYLFAGLCSKSSPNLTDMGQKQSIVSCEAEISASNPAVRRNVYENEVKPSPISVLEPTIEDDDNIAIVSSDCIKPDRQGMHWHIQSSLIDKSPPIGSIARTLSWEDSCRESATPYPHGPSLVTAGAMEEEQEWVASIEALLSTAGLGSEDQLESFSARWHTPDSPLDSSIRDKYTNMIEEPMHEGRRRQRRSNRKLVFDCVNAALVEMRGAGGYGWDNSLARRRFPSREEGGASVMLWGRIKEWFYREEECGSSEDGDMKSSQVVDRVVRKERELVGNWWAHHMKLQVDVGKEIEGKLLQELVEEVVVDLTVTPTPGSL